MKKVLLLNADYQPINLVTVKRAFNLLYKGKVEIIEESFDIIRTVNKTLKIPKIIRLYHYVYLPYKKVKLNKMNIFRRDGYKCVYCGSNKDLTIDHIIPKSRGGKNTWDNMVTSCKKCNNKKGDRTPEEAGMELLVKPYSPTYKDFVIKIYKNKLL